MLEFADNTRLALYAADAAAGPIVAFLARAAGFAQATAKANARRLAVAGEKSSVANADRVFELGPREVRRPLAQNSGAGRIYVDGSACLTEEQWMWQQLARLSACIARETLPNGGVMLHGGLAMLPLAPGPGGVLLAGRSGVGKSTASRRLPPAWRSLADDVTLVVRKPDGSYWAHPWPTWSRFFGFEAGDGSDSWKVEEAIGLKALFILEQGPGVRLERLGRGQAAAQLGELARQTSTQMVRGWPLAELAAFNLQRFANIRALAWALPVFRLHTSLDGAFWEEIERVLR